MSRYGSAVVYAAGLALLGYPPTWCDAGDAAKVRAVLRGEAS